MQRARLLPAQQRRVQLLSGKVFLLCSRAELRCQLQPFRQSNCSAHPCSSGSRQRAAWLQGYVGDSCGQCATGYRVVNLSSQAQCSPSLPSSHLDASTSRAVAGSSPRGGGSSVAKIAGGAAGAALLTAAGIAGAGSLVIAKPHLSLHQQTCSRCTCNDMLLSSQGLPGHCLTSAGIIIFAMRRRKAGQGRESQGPLQQPSCQPSATTAPAVGKTPQPAAGTPVQLQTLPREQHEWPAVLAAEGRASSEHLPRRQLPCSHSARLLRHGWLAVLLSCIACRHPLQSLSTRVHWAALGCRRLAGRQRGTCGPMLEATLCAVTQSIPCMQVSRAAPAKGRAGQPAAAAGATATPCTLP